MPHQTRSRGTSASNQDDEPMQASAPNAGHAEEGSSGSSGARMPLDQGERSQEYHTSTPDAASRPREGASTSSSSRSPRDNRSARSWDERDRRDHRDGARGSGAIFSPPPYKVRLHHRCVEDWIRDGFSYCVIVWMLCYPLVIVPRNCCSVLASDALSTFCVDVPVPGNLART